MFNVESTCEMLWVVIEVMISHILPSQNNSLLIQFINLIYKYRYELRFKLHKYLVILTLYK